jgi:HptB-dependent secretion and biofilm anti anti-sigma factor
LVASVDGSHTALAVGGELDVSRAGELTERLRAELRAPATLTLTLDLAEVTFVDSSALGALVVAQNLAEKLGKTLELINVTSDSRLRELLDLTGLVDVFSIVEAR